MKSDVSVNWILGGSLSVISAIDLNALNKLPSDQLIDSDITLKVYPSPATDFIHIEITPADTNRLFVEIIDLSGKTVINRMAVNKPLMQVDIQDLAEGTYFLKITLLNNDLSFRIEKIIKVKI